VSRTALRVARDSLHDKVALFIGDVFEYLHNRGTAKAPGDIVREVIAAIDAADSQRSTDDPLILVGHSLGGVILYDILTHFIVDEKPDFEADALVTVGSQVGLFEEMKRFHASVGDTGIIGDRTVKAIAPATRVWINIYDDVDVFSFQAEPIFDKVQDFRFSSRTGALSAHSAYFLRPTLYRRLRRRLVDAGVL
jgi:alpha-beta hydrolase superfamily lysophospholipase